MAPLVECSDRKLLSKKDMEDVALNAVEHPGATTQVLGINTEYRVATMGFRNFTGPTPADRVESALEKLRVMQHEQGGNVGTCPIQRVKEILGYPTVLCGVQEPYGCVFARKPIPDGK